MICTKDITFEKGEHIFNLIGLAEEEIHKTHLIMTEEQREIIENAKQ